MITLGIILAVDIFAGLLIVWFVTYVLQQDRFSFKTWWGRCLAIILALPVTIIIIIALLTFWFYCEILLRLRKLGKTHDN